MLHQHDAIADFERLGVIVRDHDDCNVAARFQALDQTDDQLRLRAPSSPKACRAGIMFLKVEAG